MVNSEIRLIICFATKDGEALYSQQKQDWELTVAQVMNLNKGLAISQSKVNLLSPVRLFMTPWNAAHQAPQSIGFSRQEYWSGLPFPSPGDLPDPGIKLRSPAFEEDT